MLPPLTFDDKAALAELLRRKTENISAGLKPLITLSLDVILKPSAQQQFFPYQVDNVNEGATFAGILKYRGEIMVALKNEVPMHKWDEQMILAYFCSSVEKNLNFSKYHVQTRTRLLANLAARLNDSDTPLQAAYTLVCMEYDRHAALGAEFDPANPTKHMLRFAWHLKQHPEHFIVLNQKRTYALKVNTTQYLARVRNSPQWDNTKLEATQALFDFSFEGGLEELNLAASKAKKKKIRGKGKNKKGPESAADELPVSASKLPELPTLYYESTRIHEHCRGNALLQGLVADMPGVRNIGFRVEIFDIGDLSDFNIMSLEEPDHSYEDEVEEMMARDDDAMEVDEGLCIIDGADLNLWISKRDDLDDLDF
ncbi:hypothetical protein ACET3X_009131 [Alternaria dauci]|uniref:Uncharacterized protein n=1 Tax=Alternaria dauci TaxID=48095 RepID=A0ABR3U8K7_9PLEO